MLGQHMEMKKLGLTIRVDRFHSVFLCQTEIDTVHTPFISRA